jgi:transcriptional regulator with XRE-family HTH domain
VYWYRLIWKEDKEMPVIDMAATGRRIHDLRVAAGMTIRDIQDACGVSATAVTKWQKGCAVPTIDNMVILADIWNVRIEDIVVVERR